MKSAAFEYLKPASVAEALLALREGDDAKVIAGGQSLVPLMALRLARPGLLVDINGIEGLADIATGAGVTIGALARQTALERDTRIRRRFPLIGEVVRLIGHEEIRNRGTVGGSIVHADPAAEWPALALLLGAEMVIEGIAGRRVVAASDFFAGPFRTAVDDGEILVEIRIPEFTYDGWAIEEVARRSGDFAIAGSIAAVRHDNNLISSVRLVVFNAGPVPVRLVDAEEELVGCRAADIEQVLQKHIQILDGVPADLQADTSLRRRMLGELATRAVRRSLSHPGLGAAA